MGCRALLVCVLVILLVFILVLVLSQTTAIVSRNEWGARPPKLVDHVHEPVPYVIIHHSYTPAACWTGDKCEAAMRSMQIFHQDDRGWNDIGYNFGIGGDGRIYEGRGFTVEGAHAPRYNNRSIGICVIGDWTADLPTTAMLNAVNQIIQIGINYGHVQADYILLGHRQTRPTECPGDRLFAEISTWPHFVALPTVADVDTTTATEINTVTVVTAASTTAVEEAQPLSNK